MYYWLDLQKEVPFEYLSLKLADGDRRRDQPPKDVTVLVSNLKARRRLHQLLQVPLRAVRRMQRDESAVRWMLEGLCELPESIMGFSSNPSMSMKADGSAGKLLCARISLELVRKPMS